MRVAGTLTSLAAFAATAAVAQEQPGTVSGNRIEAAPQISSSGDRGLVEEQLSSQQVVRQPVAQIATVPKNAAPLQATSDPKVGRTGVAAEIGGKDRCDPALPAAKRTRACNDVIETRAAEFERANKTELTPEQRLLLTREIQGAGPDVANATQHVAKTGQTDDQLEMGIAATVINQNQPPAKPEPGTDPKIDPQTQAIINSVLANQQPPH